MLDLRDIECQFPASFPLVHQIQGFAKWQCHRLNGEADHAHIAACRQEYACRFSKAQRFNESLPLFERVLEMCERLYGEDDHSDRSLHA